MAIKFQVLGHPGRDNALFVRIESGNSLSRLLFDCGDGCLSDLAFSEIQAIDHLFFSHLHMDHVGGFDSYFRCTFNRNTKPNIIWGPAGSASILHHRFQGFWWNLHAGQSGTWFVNEVHPSRIESSRYEISEAFEHRHNAADNSTSESEPGVIIDGPDFTIRGIHLKHNGDCLGFRVSEKPKVNIRSERVSQLGLKPGPWMQELKSDSGSNSILIDGQEHNLPVLRQELLSETAGESIAYLTDFLLDDVTFDRLRELLRRCTTVVCEAQYRESDLELATSNFHTTTTMVSRLAAEAEVGKLVLFHLSDRYTVDEWRDMLNECRRKFENTYFPSHWDLDN